MPGRLLAWLAAPAMLIAAAFVGAFWAYLA